MTDARPAQKHQLSNNSSGNNSEKDDDTTRCNSPAGVGEKNEKAPVDAQGRRELKETDCPEILAYAWPTWKKWMYLSSVAGIQISMNYNTSVFPNAVKPLATAFDIGQQEARVGQMIYLVLYSFGCELWAPWSEEFGRWPILQLSMFLINIWQIPCALAPNWGTIVVCRALVRSSNFQSWSRTNMLDRVVFLLPAVVSRSVSLPICINLTSNNIPSLSLFCLLVSVPVLVESSAVPSNDVSISALNERDRMVLTRS